MLPKLRALLFSPDFLITAALFLFALALRAYGVRGSLPYVAHPDEPKLVDSAIHIVKSGDLNPNLYIWPSLYIYLEALVVKAQTAWGVFRGYYAGPESLPDITHIYTLAPGVYVWARTLTAIVGATTVALLYWVGRDMFNGSRRVGVVAALMLAVSPLHVEYSHFALTDVPLALAGLTVLWASYRFSRVRSTGAGWRRDPALWSAVLCGLLVGIATGTKYNGLYLLVVPLIAWMMRIGSAERGMRKTSTEPALFRTPRSALRALAAIPLAAVVGFLLCEPYAILDWPRFWSGFTFQVEAYVPARDFGEAWQSVQRHITDLSASDAHFFMPAAIGAVALLLNEPVRNRAWLLLPFPLLYLLAMSRFSLTYVRNLLVTLPFLALVCGYAVDLLATQVVTMARGWEGMKMPSSRRLWGAVRWGLVAAALAFIATEPLRVSAAYTAYMGDQDSRNVAWEWLQERMREGKRVAAELHPWQTQEWPDVLAFDVENPGNWQPLTMRPPVWYARRGYDLLAVSSNYYEWRRDPAIWPLYKALPVVRTFPGDVDGGKGATITVLDAGRAEGARLPALSASEARIEDFAALEGNDLAPLTSTGVLLDPVDAQPSQEYRRGEAIGLNLYYRALRDPKPSDPNWQVWIHLVDPATGNTVAQVDVQPLAGLWRNYPQVARVEYPVVGWHKGELIAGSYNLALPADLPPGAYRLETGMWVPPDGPGARITPGEGGQAPANQIVLGEITVR